MCLGSFQDVEAWGNKLHVVSMYLAATPVTVEPTIAAARQHLCCKIIDTAYSSSDSARSRDGQCGAEIVIAWANGQGHERHGLGGLQAN